MNVALSCEGVSVRYGALQALDNVSLDFEAGKIHALLGQNGAGKTTLARFFSGLTRSEAGELAINGRMVPAGDVAGVRARGLDIVHQRFTLPPTFSVSDALELTAYRKKGRSVFSTRAVAEAWREEMRSAGIAASPHATVSSLPIETIQSLEILRALSGDAHILILDEPTALLSPGAIDALFDRLRRLRDQGVTLLVILHKLQEVQEIADTVSILRDGRLVLAPTPTGNTTSAMLSDMMIGQQEMAGSSMAGSGKVSTGDTLVSVDRVSTTGGMSAGVELRDVSFSIDRHEILGVAGIEGNGQRQLAELLCGFCEISQGSVSLDGRDLMEMNATERRAAGVRNVPFDRMSEGASLETPLWENVLAWRSEEFCRNRLPFVSIGEMKRQAGTALGTLGVKYDTLDNQAVSLSGGNLQRLVLARELVDGAVLLVAAQPTRGLDFGAARFVLGYLELLRSEGSAVVLISSDLDELFEVSDRIIVLRGGRVSGQFHPPFSRRSVGDAMVGAAR